MTRFNHFDTAGNAVMVDVSEKKKSLRIARARGVVTLTPALVAAIMEGGTTKGDVLGVARIAGIAAAKRTPELIPLSHPLSLHHVAIDLTPDPVQGEVVILATVKAFERTGVEMEAMTAAAVAALTVYDMCKGVEKGITISQICLISKEGGKSGRWERTPLPQESS
ncbi:MAG: cyclic pyranopterin monophosphate synthase MoaC [Desulfuromonadia bacterium]